MAVRPRREGLEVAPRRACREAQVLNLIRQERVGPRMAQRSADKNSNRRREGIQCRKGKDKRQGKRRDESGTDRRDGAQSHAASHAARGAPYSRAQAASGLRRRRPFQ